MKIVVLGTRGFPGVQGGVENHCEKLYTHLAEKGCEIIVFTRKSYVDTNIRVFKGVSLLPLSCPQNKFLEAIVHTFRGILKARGLSPDILHIHAIGPSLFVPFARILGMKVIVTNHGPDYNRKKWSFPARMFLKFCELLGATFANEIIAVADNIAIDIKRKFRRDSFVLPNGVEIPQLVDTDNVLRKFDLQKKKYILAVGRFVPEKGFNDIIEAFNQINKDSGKKVNNIADWKLVIVGGADHEDSYSRKLKMKASKYRNVILPGFLTGQPLYEVYSHAGVFVLPSYHEGLPIVLLEAMSFGLSCIASDIPANRNIELHEDRFFKAGDIGLLSEKMRDFMDKPLGEEDRKRQIGLIAEKYNWERIAGETLKIYRKVAL